MKRVLFVCTGNICRSPTAEGVLRKLVADAGLADRIDALGGRLPELFAGLTVEEMPVPVRYPTSCSPQAWASAAPLLVLRALLGLEPDVPGGTVSLDPRLPDGSRYLRVEGLPLGEAAGCTIEVNRGEVTVEGLPDGLAVTDPA